MNESPRAARQETADPAGYRARLRGLLGDLLALEVLAATPRELRALFVKKDLARVRKRPAPGKWSAMEILGHLTDVEWTIGYRSRTVLCDESPAIVPMDQNLWVEVQNHAERQPGELLDAFESLRSLNLALWRRIPPQDLGRVGRHGERGEESLQTLIDMTAGHDLNHLAQIDRALANR